MELENLITLRAKSLETITRISSWTDISLKDEFIQKLSEIDSPTLIQKNKYSIVVQVSSENIAIIPSQYFIMAHKAIPYLSELKKYYNTLKIVKDNYNDFDQYIYTIEKEKKGETPIPDLKIDNAEATIKEFLISRNYNEDSANYFIRFLTDSIFRGGKSQVNEKNRTLKPRAESDFIGAYILSSLPIPAASSGIIGKLLFNIVSVESIFTELKNDNFFTIQSDKIKREILNDVNAANFVQKVLQFLDSKNELDDIKSLTTPPNTENICNLIKDSFHLISIFKVVPTTLNTDINDNSFFTTSVFTYNSFNYHLNKNWTSEGARSLNINIFKEIVNLLFVKKYVINEHDGIYSLVLVKEYPKNRILYGAPGTGKSFLLREQIATGYSYRITFNPDLTYGQFIGTYKPVPEKTAEGKDIITYKLIPGPFLQALKKAYDLLSNGEQVYIIIEELNRANVSAVFGDVFQLLDRNNDGSSEYGITFSSDIMNWLVHETSIVSSKEEEVKIPRNLNIWATMNSADQGVFPLDSAFKRRWTFEYIGIDQGEDVIKDYEIKINDAFSINWNSLRKALNRFLMSKGINEDKLIGPFFLSRSEMSVPGSFEGKLLLYLWEDVLRHKNKGNLFKVNSLSDAHKVIKASTSLENLLKNLFTDTFVADSNLIPEEN